MPVAHPIMRFIASCSVLALVAALCAANLFAQQVQQPGWQWQNPLPQGNAINSIRFATDQRHGWAIGGDAAILRTDNGGFEWETQLSPVRTTFYGLAVQSKSRAIISGAGGVILTTKNGGDKWLARPTGSRDHLFTVTLAPDNPMMGWTAGTFGALLATTDGGLTWKAQNSHTTAHLFSIAFVNTKRE